jgi:hypothetical protein
MKITQHRRGEWQDGDKALERCRFHEIEAVAAVGDSDATGLYANLSRFNASSWGDVEAGHLQFFGCKCDRNAEHWDIRITLRETTLGYNDPCELLVDGELKSLAEVTHHKLFGEPVEFRDFLGTPTAVQ